MKELLKEQKVQFSSNILLGGRKKASTMKEDLEEWSVVNGILRIFTLQQERGLQVMQEQLLGKLENT